MRAPDLTPREVRRQLDEVLRTDADLDAFCLDHFPAVHRRFGAGMERTAKVTLLLQLVPGLDLIAARLREHAGEAPGPASAARPSVSRTFLAPAAIGMAVLLLLGGVGLGLWRLWGTHATAPPPPAPVTAPAPAAATPAAPTASATNSDNAIGTSPDARMRNVVPAPAPGQPARINSGNRIEGSAGAQMTNEVRGSP